MTYAIISLGGKQYRVQEGQRLLVDQLSHADGKSFHPHVLLLGGDGKTEFAPKGTPVTAKVVGGALGDKIRIGKYKKRTGYRRHTGHRSKLTEIEITVVGAKAAAKPKTATAAKPAAESKPKPKATAAQIQPDAQAKPAAQTQPDAQPKTAAAKPAEESAVEPAPEEGAE